jgi:hypothetical protein
MPSTPTTNAYVGMAKTVPDSRMPRRFISVSSATMPSAAATLFSAIHGIAEPMFSTPDDTDTATVST